ncbi:MAG: DUF1624 domain-containing protein [Thermoanaerobaculia bacterium]
MTATTASALVCAVPAPKAPPQRVISIDWMRGIVMVLMALDHVRFFFTDVPFPPENIERTSLLLFMTRWVTHFCAPLFFFLAGVSAWLSGRRRNDLPRWLALRGIWLVLLELTIIGFGWNFAPGYSFAGVIWALGWSMVILSMLVRIEARVLAVLSLLVIAAHDLLSRVSPESFGRFELVWRLLHVPGDVRIGSHEWFVLYPLIPWFAVMSLGYACGVLWTWDQRRRRSLLLWSGAGATILFVILRIANAYGNPANGGSGSLPFHVYADPAKTIISLLNVAKYPPSLQYLLMTLGPPLIAMALAEGWFNRHGVGWVQRAIVTFGRVPMFYYICHLYLIHIAALIVAVVVGQPWQWLGWRGDQSVVPPPGYGHGLAFVYAMWLAIVTALYLPCRMFERVKRERRSAWMQFV